jgi:hypothetical protein
MKLVTLYMLLLLGALGLVASVTVTHPVSLADGTDPMPLCRPGKAGCPNR